MRLTYGFIIALVWIVKAGAQMYTTCATWEELVHGVNHKYAKLVRVSDPGSSDKPVYTGFWYFDVEQFDPSGRYALAMKVTFQNREVQVTDTAEIGYYDLRKNFMWKKIGRAHV